MGRRHGHELMYADS